MTQSLGQRWRPGTVLRVLTASDDVSCAGTTLKGLPCGWRLDPDQKEQAREVLQWMSESPPREAIDDLPKLARLCLCQKNHQAQASKVVAKWTTILETYASSLERESAPARPIKAPVGQSSNGTSRAARLSGPILSFDEITAELAALSLRQEELKSMLRDSHPVEGRVKSKGASGRPSFPQSSPHQANLNELSESEFSRTDEDERRGSSASRDGFKRFFGRGKQTA